ncbi:MAG: zinc-binding dehydrogenase, partial [Halomonas sp.]
SGYPDIITINPVNENPVERIKKETGGRGVDIAYEAVGHASPIEGVAHPVRSCVQSIRGAGKIMVLGLADDVAPVNMKELILKEGKIIASRVSHGEFKETINNLSGHKLKAENLITNEVQASEAQEAFRMLEEAPQNHLKILLEL